MTMKTCVVYLSLVVIAAKMTSAGFPSMKNCTGSHCGNPLSINLKQIQRLQRIKQQILLALGFQADQSKKNSEKNEQTNKNIASNLSDVTTPIRENAAIISYSESVGKKRKKRNVLQFVINTGSSGKENLEVISAHLWLRIKKRRSAKHSKTIVLKVFKILEKDKALLTYLRTRVKETRWQKLSLPISLVQELVKPPEGRLQLKIECKRCGRIVKIILPKYGSKVPATSSKRTLRHRKMKKSRTRPCPFLVINTRIKSTS